MGNLLLLASYPKSGNTWTRIFLVNLFTNSKEPVPLAEIGKLSTGDTAAEWYRAVDASDDRAWSYEHVARLRHGAQRHVAGLSPDTMFMKTHAALLPWEGVPPFAQDVLSGAIYIVRNPLDVAQSYARHNGTTIDQTIDVMGRKDYVTKRFRDLLPYLQGGWSQNVRSWTQHSHPRIHVMRYEDMVADPVAAFGGLTAFLGVDAPAERLQRAIAHSDLENLRELEREEGFVERTSDDRRFFGGGGVGAWRRDLTREQAQRIIARHGEQMARFGYLPEDL